MHTERRQYSTATTADRAVHCEYLISWVLAGSWLSSFVIAQSASATTADRITTRLRLDCDCAETNCYSWRWTTVRQSSSC